MNVPPRSQLEPLDAPARHRLQPRVLQAHDPVLALLPVRVGLPAGQINRHAVAQLVVVEEERLDHVAAVAERDVEFFEAVVRVVLHDVPEDGPPADLDHRLGLDFGLLR